MLVEVPNKSTLFGPMQQDPSSIREKLFRGIDGDYNVVDMGIVQEVIGQLETFTITREELEATRLGRAINELRRKTEDRGLASRAKSLIKKWKSLLPSGPPPGGGAPALANNHVTNGSRLHPAVSPRLPPISPRLAPSGPRTPLVSPRSHVSSAPRTPLVSPRLPPVSPRSQPPGGPGRPAPRPVPPSPALSKSGLGTGTRTSPVRISSSTSTSPSRSASRPASPVTVELESREPSPSLNAPSRPPSRSPSPEIIMVTEILSPVKRARPREESPEVEVLQQPRPKKVKMTNGSRESSLARQHSPAMDKARLRRKLPRGAVKADPNDILNQQMAKARFAKVRTTQELVQNLGIDSRAASISPPSSHPVTDLVPKETQDQRMSRFFQSQAEAEAVSRPSTAASEVTASSGLTSADPSRGPTPLVADTVEDVMALLPPIDPAAVLEEWRKAQGEEGEQVEEEEEEEVEVEGLIPVLKPEKAELSEEMVSGLNNGQLEHIGGIKDHEGEFREWHEMTSLLSKDGEVLHILPYSVID